MLFFRKTHEEHQKHLADGIRQAVFGDEFEDFVRYLRSPWSIMWSNLLGGIFRGLGIIIGMTIVLAILVWFLAGLVDFPLLGNYIEEIVNTLQKYDVQSGIR